MAGTLNFRLKAELRTPGTVEQVLIPDHQKLHRRLYPSAAEQAFFVVVGVDEPAGDTIGVAVFDCAGLRFEDVFSFFAITFQITPFGADSPFAGPGDLERERDPVFLVSLLNSGHTQILQNQFREARDLVVPRA